MQMNDVTRILPAIEEGDPKAPEQLLPLVCEELRKLAAQRLARESAGQTLTASALAAEDPTKAELVKLRYFGGLSVEDAGRVLGISRATADRYWAYARVWLYSELSEPGGRATGMTKE
jgi:DNA-directed RNA polymerase specialized sigma24 family protein